MSVSLKPVEDQVIVITGATSGIGLTTAHRAARRGAKLVLAARDREALERVALDIREQGGDVVHVVADVADAEAVEQIANAAIRSWGHLDTWVNNAGVSVYGRLEDTPMEDHRRLFETNYWGVVNGSLVAARHLRRRGGAIVNLGSVLSDRAVPIQGAYSATKHAVKGFTNALRMELEMDDVPVSVTLIKPGSIDTMFEEHAKNLMPEGAANLPPPVYDPELVARAILHAAEHPVRDLFVGGGGKLISMSETWAPRMTDRLMERSMRRMQTDRHRRRGFDDSLHAPSRDGQESLGHHDYVRRTSLYTEAQMHPWTTTALLAGLGAAAWLAFGRGDSRNGESRGSTQRPRRRYIEEYPDLEEGEIGHNAKPAGVAAREGHVVFPE